MARRRKLLAFVIRPELSGVRPASASSAGGRSSVHRPRSSWTPRRLAVREGVGAVERARISMVFFSRRGPREQSADRRSRSVPGRRGGRRRRSSGPAGCRKRIPGPSCRTARGGDLSLVGKLHLTRIVSLSHRRGESAGREDTDARWRSPFSSADRLVVSMTRPRTRSWSGPGRRHLRRSSRSRRPRDLQQGFGSIGFPEGRAYRLRRRGREDQAVGCGETSA